MTADSASEPAAPRRRLAQGPVAKPLKVRIIGAPVDLGQTRRGVDMGPSAIRAAGLHAELEALGHEVADAGNIFSPEKETRRLKDERARYLPEVVAACETLANKVERTVRKGFFPVVLGGDHSIAMGTMGGLARVEPAQGLIWFDAHGDFNVPETTPSGNIHGMPFAHITGRGDERLANIAGVAPKVKEDAAVLLGIRDLDPGEKEVLADSKVTVFTMRDIDEMGVKKVMDEAVQVATRGTKGLHASFDIDIVDPRWAPGSGTTVPGGISFREAHLCMEMLADSGRLTSFELVEVNPLLDEANKTGRLAVGLVASALGKRII